MSVDIHHHYIEGRSNEVACRSERIGSRGFKPFGVLGHDLGGTPRNESGKA